MSITRFHHGVSSFGVPMVGNRFSNPWSTHYFVDGISGSDGNVGTSPEEAFLTIQAAITASTGGDVIYIRPKAYTLGTGFARYTEDVSVTLGGAGGSGITATNANKSLIGVSQRGHASDFLGVRWKFTTATSLTVDAPCLHVENIGFFSEDATYAINLRCNGATRTQEGTTGFSIYNCAIKGDGKLYGNGCNEVQIISCRFQAKYDGTVGGISLVGSSNQVIRPLIQDCEFLGGNANNMSDAPIQMLAPVYDAIMRDIYFNAETDTGTYVTVSGSGNTGLIANVHCASADVSTTTFTKGGLFCVGIYDSQGIQVDA